MADVIIMGMEMPHDCPHCEFAAIGYASPMSSGCTLYCRAVDKFKDCATEIMKDKSYEEISQYDTRPDWCPLLPLPEWHGRLGDLDALSKQFEHLASLDWNQKAAPYSWAYAYSEAQAAVDDSPTIVPGDVTDIDVGNKKEGGGE